MRDIRVKESGVISSLILISARWSPYELEPIKSAPSVNNLANLTPNTYKFLLELTFGCKSLPSDKKEGASFLLLIYLTELCIRLEPPYGATQ